MYASLCIGCGCLVLNLCICMHVCLSVCVHVRAHACVRECLSVPEHNEGSTVWTKNASLENDSVIWGNLNTLLPSAVSTEAMGRGKCVARQLRVAWQGSQKTEPERPCFPKISFQQKVLVFLTKPQ